MSESKESVIYDGCAVGTMCEGICRKKYKKEGCPAFYRYKTVRKINKHGKKTRRFSIIEV